MGVLAVGGRVKWGRVRVLGRVDGRVQRVRCWVRVQQVPIHDILVCPELLTFEMARVELLHSILHYYIILIYNIILGEQIKLD